MKITGKTRVLGVWGFPVSHSRSPAMHNAALEVMGLDWVYVAFPVNPDNAGAAVAAVRALDLVGVNITVPLKETVAGYLDDVDPDAARIGSVNTIVNRNGRLLGYSTDGPGFLWDLARQGVSYEGHPALIWGAGGSARALAHALTGRGCAVTIANRTLERAQKLAAEVGAGTVAVGFDDPSYLEHIAAARLLVNATTLGMGPANIEQSPPIPQGSLSPSQVVYDLVYVPEHTRLIAVAESAGCRAIGGLGMLACQGAVSLSHWTGLPIEQIPVSVMLDALAPSPPRPSGTPP